MVGGYFVQPKLGENLQKTQLLVQSASKNPLNIKVTGPGKVGMIACVPGKEFPLPTVTDIIQSSQIQDNVSEFVIDCPNPVGFVLYVISEGAECEVSIDGNGKLILDVVHGNLAEIPPKLAKIGERKKNLAAMILKEKYWLKSYTLEMHGAYITEQEKGEIMEDTQFIVYAPTGNQVKINATGQGVIALMALKKEEEFPLHNVTDSVIGYATETNNCTLEVTSPGPDGFIIYVMSNYQQVSVSIDGLGNMLLGITYSDDHKGENHSSISQSSRSSIYKRAEFRAPIKQFGFVMKFEKRMQGGNEIDAEPGLTIMENNQLLVYTATGTKLSCAVKGEGKIGIIAMERDSFPLVKTTSVLGSTLNQTNEASLTIDSPGPRGVVFYIIGAGLVNVNINGGDKMLLEVAHSVVL